MRDVLSIKYLAGYSTLPHETRPEDHCRCLSPAVGLVAGNSSSGKWFAVGALGGPGPGPGLGPGAGPCPGPDSSLHMSDTANGTRPSRSRVPPSAGGPFPACFGEALVVLAALEAPHSPLPPL